MTTTHRSDAQGRGRARIAALVPFTNVNLEPDLQLLKPRGASIHVARLGGYDVDEIPSTAQMAGLGAANCDDAAALIAGARPDIVLYGCTSATLSHGAAFDAVLAERIERTTGAPTFTAAGALVQALDALAVRRIGFASPYTVDLNDHAIAFLAETGVETVARADVHEPLGNYGQGALTPDEVFALALRADHPAADALVLSCTDMRAVECVDALERRLRKPVVASNQAMMFVAARRLGASMAHLRCGRLFDAVASPLRPDPSEQSSQHVR